MMIFRKISNIIALIYNKRYNWNYIKLGKEEYKWQIEKNIIEEFYDTL